MRMGNCESILPVDTTDILNEPTRKEMNIIVRKVNSCSVSQLYDLT